MENIEWLPILTAVLGALVPVVGVLAVKGLKALKAKAAATENKVDDVAVEALEGIIAELNKKEGN